ncbi:MAG: hypothetical protein ACX930_04910 [Erythrobacter sp.]
MQVHSEIEALRSDPASQRRSADAMGAALATWHRQTEVTDLQRELATYSHGGELDECTALSLLLSDHVRARSFVVGFVRHFTAALRDEPLGEVPFRRSSSDGFSRVQLLRSGGAVLSICAYEPRIGESEPETVQFVDCASTEIVVSGTARVRTYRREGGAVLRHHHEWRAGERLARRPGIHARHVLSVENSLLVLQLTRAPACPGPSLEIQLSDGAIVRRISGDKRASEQVMALAVLGALGDTESTGPIAAFARACDHDNDARWEAVRQSLALDARQGVDLLCELSQRTGDALSAPARALCEELERAHPVLRAQKEEPA